MHPSTDRAQRMLISLIETNDVTTTPRRHPCMCSCVLRRYIGVIVGVDRGRRDDYYNCCRFRCWWCWWRWWWRWWWWSWWCWWWWWRINASCWRRRNVGQSARTGRHHAAGQEETLDSRRGRGVLLRLENAPWTRLLAFVQTETSKKSSAFSVTLFCRPLSLLFSLVNTFNLTSRLFTIDNSDVKSSRTSWPRGQNFVLVLVRVLEDLSLASALALSTCPRHVLELFIRALWNRLQC